MFSELEPLVDAWLQGRAETDAALPQQEKRMLFRSTGMQMYTKLRPGVREFLSRTATKFELWIHTNGTSFFSFLSLNNTNSFFFRYFYVKIKQTPVSFASNHSYSILSTIFYRESSLRVCCDPLFRPYRFTF
jgi:hypothetical protein